MLRTHWRAFVLLGVAAVLVILGTFAWAQYGIVPATLPGAATSNETTLPETPTERTPSTVETRPVIATGTEVRATATLVVDGTRYALTAPEGTTLKEAMDRLASESDFSYEFRNYTGLGAFVTGINDRASTGDLVWILYINGAKSTTGISSTRIRSSDLIEWKLEKSY